ncbi:MAG TPA: tetratricopeptide repeat protein [Pirellulales bacterium]|nr:tetratricopeptide repeat protein [Pirellulales bacterium]
MQHGAQARHSSHTTRHHGAAALYTLGPSFYTTNYVLQCNPWLMKPPVYFPPQVSSLTLGRGALLPPVLPPGRPPGIGGAALVQRVGPGAAGPAADRLAIRSGFLRGISQESRHSRAALFIRFGDDHFRKQSYNEALQRYKDASKGSPELADPYFRQAFAWAAMSKYDQAAKALHRGLSLDAQWPAGDFQLKQLYGDNRLAKSAHWEAMAKAASGNPPAADLLLLLAVELYCDGQRDRSRAFFQRASALEPGDTSHIQAFLSRLNLAVAKAQ